MKAAARSDDRLTTVLDALADGIVRLESDPCIGVQLRGIPTGRALCELRITRRRKSWRIIYAVRPPGRIAHIHLIGEHYLPTKTSSFFGAPRVPRTRLANRAGLPDLYVDLAKHLGLSDAEIRAMVDEVRRGLKQPACC